jgi:DNA ligase (NAD+)
MYNKETEIKLARLGKSLLSQAPNTDITETIAALREVIRHSDWRYYVQDDPITTPYSATRNTTSCSPN